MPSSHYRDDNEGLISMIVKPSERLAVSDCGGRYHKSMLSVYDKSIGSHLFFKDTFLRPKFFPLGRQKVSNASSFIYRFRFNLTNLA